MCSITGVGERLHKVLGLIDLGTLDSGEQSLPFGLLVYRSIFSSYYSQFGDVILALPCHNQLVYQFLKCPLGTGMHFQTLFSPLLKVPRMVLLSSLL